MIRRAQSTLGALVLAALIMTAALRERAEGAATRAGFGAAWPLFDDVDEPIPYALADPDDWEPSLTERVVRNLVVYATVVLALYVLWVVL